MKNKNGLPNLGVLIKVLVDDYEYPEKRERSWIKGCKLLDYGARFYDPSIARFSSIDPLVEKFPSWSSYTYAFNNPLRYIDPTGMAPQTVVPEGKREEKLIEYFKQNASSEMLALYHKLHSSDVTFTVVISSIGEGNLGPTSLGNTSVDYADAEDTNVTISIAGNLSDALKEQIGVTDGGFQLSALGDEFTHGAQFLDGEIGYTNVPGEAVAYDVGDEYQSRVNGIKTAESCGCGLINNDFDFSIASEQKRKEMINATYNLPTQSINVRNFLKNGKKGNVKGSEVYHRVNGKTVITPLNQ